MKTDKHIGRYFLISFAAALILMVVLAVKEGVIEAAVSGNGKDTGLFPWKNTAVHLPFSNIFEIIPPFGKKEEITPQPPVIQPGTQTEILIRNDTSFKIDQYELLAKRVSVKLGSEGVQVLIVHTHGTEAYTPHGSDTYKASDEYRTLNESQNMLRVGEELKNALESYGIKTVHCMTLCDYPNYNSSYDNARKEIEKYLKQYPTVQIVIDLHRDAILLANGEYYRASTVINGKNAAKIEFVVGTDGGGLYHPNWRDNMSFQLQIHQCLEEMYPGITRPMNVRAARFNQHFRTGSMLVEIGTCGNYLEEALYSARLFADALAQVLGKR